MKVAVTGGNGRLGAFVIDSLVSHGYEVMSIDVTPSRSPDSESAVVDMRDVRALTAAMRDVEAVVHLARVPFPYTSQGLNPSSRTWRIPDSLGDAERFGRNVEITYNVLATCFELGINKAVLGSSLTIYGLYYPVQPTAPDYLPVDEEHPRRPQDPYSLSKLIGEEMCDAFARKSTMQIASLRFAGITADLTHGVLRERSNDPRRWAGALWSYIDVRDAAGACRLALEAPLSGHQAFNICASTTTMNVATSDLAKQYFPNVNQIREGLNSNWSGYSPEKAGKLLNFRARYLLQP